MEGLGHLSAVDELLPCWRHGSNGHRNKNIITTMRLSPTTWLTFASNAKQKAYVSCFNKFRETEQI